MGCLPSSSKGAETIRFTFITSATVSQQKSGRAEQAHATCIMSAGYSVAIKSCLSSSAWEKIKKAFDMFIKQQGSHYCTQQSLSQCSHIVACTCSLRTVRLIVSLFGQAVHSFPVSYISWLFHLFVLRRWHTCIMPFLDRRACSGQVSNYFSNPPTEDLIIHS